MGAVDGELPFELGEAYAIDVKAVGF